MYQHSQNDFTSANDLDLKEVWYAERGLLDMFQDKPEDLIGFIRECSASDLHQFDAVHGVANEVPVFKAILAHPLCDRATALNIYAACEPAYFDAKVSEGLTLADLDDEEDRVHFEILTEAHHRLSTRESWRGRFTYNAAGKWRALPHTNPSNLTHFRLSPTATRETSNQVARSAIIYEYSTIALSFDAWRNRH